MGARLKRVLNVASKQNKSRNKSETALARAPNDSNGEVQPLVVAARLPSRRGISPRIDFEWLGAGWVGAVER